MTIARARTGYAFAILLLSLVAAPPLKSSVQGQTAPPSSTTATAAQSMDPRSYDIEQKKLAQQQFSAWLTLITILVTAVLGFATVAYNLWNANKQAQLQAKLKAIDVVISAAGPNSARQRLIVVRKLMGSDLVLGIEPKDLEAAGIGAGHDQDRKDLIKMLIDNRPRELEVLDLWHAVFCNTNLDPDILRLRSLIEARQNSSGGSISSA